VSSADNVAPAPHKPRRRRNNRTGRGANRRPAASRPSAASQQDDWAAASGGASAGLVENGVSDAAGATNNTKPDGSAKPQRRPRDKTTDTDTAAMTTKQ